MSRQSRFHGQQHAPSQQPQKSDPLPWQQYGVPLSVQHVWPAAQQLPPQQVAPAAQQLSPQTGPVLWQAPFTHCWHGPHEPQLPMQPSEPQTLPVQSGVQHGITPTQMPTASGLRHSSGKKLVVPDARSTPETTHRGNSPPQSASDAHACWQKVTVLPAHSVAPSGSWMQTAQRSDEQTSSQARQTPFWQLGVSPSGHVPHCNVPPQLSDCGPQTAPNS